MKPDWNPAPRMDTHTRNNLESAAHTAKQLWPDALGELVSTTLLDIAEFGYRIGGDALARRLVARVQDEQRRRERVGAA